MSRDNPLILLPYSKHVGLPSAPYARRQQDKTKKGLPWLSSGRESVCQCRETGLIPGPGTLHVPSGN